MNGVKVLGSTRNEISGLFRVKWWDGLPGWCCLVSMHYGEMSKQEEELTVLDSLAVENRNRAATEGFLGAGGTFKVMRASYWHGLSSTDTCKRGGGTRAGTKPMKRTQTRTPALGGIRPRGTATVTSTKTEG